MSKHSQQKIERRRKREKKQQRRNYQRWLVAHAKYRRFEERQAQKDQEQNGNLDRQALRPPTNTVSRPRNDHVLAPKQGFDPAQWQPND